MRNVAAANCYADRVVLLLLSVSQDIARPSIHASAQKPTTFTVMIRDLGNTRGDVQYIEVRSIHHVGLVENRYQFASNFIFDMVPMLFPDIFQPNSTYTTYLPRGSIVLNIPGILYWRDAMFWPLKGGFCIGR